MSVPGRPQVGLSLMLEGDFMRAAYPLFEAGEVEVLEWSFDCGWPPTVMPSWANELVRCYSDAGNLLGHGVSYSPLSAGTDDFQQAWLDSLSQELGTRHYRHISEHFGFASTRNFHQSAPLPVPLTDSILRLGQDRLQRLATTAQVPIGLENLAFAFSMRDVRDQGRFLDLLLDPTDGFVLLDLHNLFCQSINFDVSLDELLASYPLRRVVELHVSGGSWSDGGIRRDTHDGPVPKVLFGWLPRVLERCPRVEAVIFERMGGTIAPTDDEQFRRDFRRLKEVVHE